MLSSNSYLPSQSRYGDSNLSGVAYDRVASHGQRIGGSLSTRSVRGVREKRLFNRYIPHTFSSTNMPISTAAFSTISPRNVYLNSSVGQRCEPKGSSVREVKEELSNLSMTIDCSRSRKEKRYEAALPSGSEAQTPITLLHSTPRSMSPLPASNHGVGLNGIRSFSGRVNSIKGPNEGVPPLLTPNSENSALLTNAAGSNTTQFCFNRNTEMLKGFINSIYKQQSTTQSASRLVSNSSNGCFSKQSGRLGGSMTGVNTVHSNQASVSLSSLSMGNLELGILSHQFRNAVHNCHTHIGLLLNACEGFVDRVDYSKIDKEAGSATESVKSRLMRLVSDIKCLRRIVQTDLSQVMISVFRDISVGLTNGVDVSSTTTRKVRDRPSTASRLRRMSMSTSDTLRIPLSASSASPSHISGQGIPVELSGMYFIRGIAIAYIFVEQLYEIGDHLLSSAKTIAEYCPLLETEIVYLSLIREKLYEVIALAVKYTDSYAIRLPAGEALKMFFSLKMEQNASVKYKADCRPMTAKQQLPTWFLDFYDWLLRCNVSTIQQCKETLMCRQKASQCTATADSSVDLLAAVLLSSRKARPSVLGDSHVTKGCPPTPVTPSTAGEYARFRTPTGASGGYSKPSKPMAGGDYSQSHKKVIDQMSLKDVISADEAQWELFANGGGLKTLGVAIEGVYNSNCMMDADTDDEVTRLLTTVPWPTVALQTMATMLNITIVGVSRENQLRPHQSQPLSPGDTEMMSEYIKVLQRRWHPDRFHHVINLYGDVSGRDSEVLSSLLKQVTKVAQAINYLKDYL